MSAGFQQAAEKIADEIHENVRHARDGNVYWLGPTLVEEGRALFRPLGPYLYPGTLGVALFLAACERHRRRGIDRDLCLRAITPFRKELREISASLQVGEHSRLLGGFSGLGSCIYALLTIGDLLELPELRDDAHLVASLITPEVVREDRKLDVMFGSAGAILALLALERGGMDEDRSRGSPLSTANLCARHLLGSRVPSPAGGQGWPSGPGGTLTGGFAHGSAGICYALLRLFQRTGAPELQAAAQDGIEHERSLYVPEEGNWRIAWRPDLRFVNTWCNGLPGIALGRIGGLGGWDVPGVHEEIARALELTRALDLDADDHVCCGNMGRVEVLLFASRRFGDPALLAAARQLAELIVLRAGERGSFGLMPACAGLFDPRFFLGITGIGYTLLHLLDPDLPSVAALESDGRSKDRNFSPGDRS